MTRDKAKCKHCGEEIWASQEYRGVGEYEAKWYHSKTRKRMCYPTSTAEPEDEK